MFCNSCSNHVFEVVPLESLGLEVTNMRKWLDIVPIEIPIGIQREIKNICKKNIL